MSAGQVGIPDLLQRLWSPDGSRTESAHPDAAVVTPHGIRWHAPRHDDGLVRGFVAALRREGQLVAHQARAARNGVPVRSARVSWPRSSGNGALVDGLLRRGFALRPDVARCPDLLIDQVLANARLHRPTRYQLSRGGGLLAATRTLGGVAVVLRLAEAASPADPHRSLPVLDALAHRSEVPDVLRAGERGGVGWVVERRLPGRVPHRLGPGLHSDVVSLLRAMPMDESPARAPADDLDRVVTRLPEAAGPLGRVLAAIDGPWADGPSVARHGDLWTGNLLAVRDCLTGVVDWDAAHLAAVPGADLLELVVTDRRRRRRLSLGEAWLEGWWRDQAAVDGPLRDYWRGVGPTPDGDRLEAVGLAWWLAEVAGTLTRIPARARDDSWLSRNVWPVLERV